MTDQHDHNRHDETVLRILNTAKDIFAEVGFAGARMDEIARRAGVNKATIYYHIGDKQALYEEVIHHVIGSTADRIAENIEQVRSPEEKIKAYIRTMAEAMDQNPQMPSIMMREMASGGHNLPKVALEDFFRIIGIVKEILDRGQKEGLFTESIPVLVHMMVVGTLAIYKMSKPIRSKYEGLPEEIRKLDDRVSGQIAAHLTEMMIKALKQTDQLKAIRKS